MRWVLGYIWRVPASASADSARLWPRAVCGMCALILGLMCAVLAIDATSGGEVAMTGAVGSSMDTTSVGPIFGAAAPVASAIPSMTAAMCDGVCIAEVSSGCAVGVGLIVTTVLVLLLATRRDTYLALQARSSTLTRGHQRRRHRTPWTVLTPISLCVLRV